MGSLSQSGIKLIRGYISCSVTVVYFWFVFNLGPQLFISLRLGTLPSRQIPIFIIQYREVAKTSSEHSAFCLVPQSLNQHTDASESKKPEFWMLFSTISFLQNQSCLYQRCCLLSLHAVQRECLCALLSPLQALRRLQRLESVEPLTVSFLVPQVSTGPVAL